MPLHHRDSGRGSGRAAIEVGEPITPPAEVRESRAGKLQYATVKHPGSDGSNQFDRATREICRFFQQPADTRIRAAAASTYPEVAAIFALIRQTQRASARAISLFRFMTVVGPG